MEVKFIKGGQLGPYKDSVYVYEVHIEPNETISEEEILKACNNGRRLPIQEWKKRWDSAEDYFRGHYILTKTSYGFSYIGTDPYTD